MMRGPKRWAVAVRQPDGRIWLESHPHQPIADRVALMRVPLLRGVGVLIDSMGIGARSMRVSAARSLDEPQEIGPKQVGGSIVFSLLLMTALFVVLPNVIANIGGGGGSRVVYALKEGSIRVGIFVAYLLLLSSFRDIKRIFQYHGAEHQAIQAFEEGESSLTPEAVMRYPTAHVRCGTNFLIITLLLTLVVYAFLGRHAIWVQLLERILWLGVIAGASYEFLKLGARRPDVPLVRAIMKPGLWLQRITTKQPTPTIVEVAVRSLGEVIPEDRRGIIPGYPSEVVGPTQAT